MIKKMLYTVAAGMLTVFVLRMLGITFAIDWDDDDTSTPSP